MSTVPPLDVLHLPAFVSDPGPLLEWAYREIVWDARMHARQTASFGLAYDYAGMTYPDVAMPPRLQTIAHRVASIVGHPLTNCLANLYETGASRMGFHADAAAMLAPGTSIAIVSLGAARTLTFRSNDAARLLCPIRLEPGSLLVMRPSVQDLWKHALLPEPGAERRISLTFRHVVRSQPVT